MTRLLVALLAVALVGCGEAVFQCSNGSDCTGGFCEPNGYCSFDDPACPSGRRYGEFAGDGLANTCTPVSEDGTESTTQAPTDPSTTTNASTSSSTSPSSSGLDPETTTPASSSTETTMSVDDSTSETGSTTDASGSSSSTGLAGPFTMSFGDRDDADVQGITVDSSVMSWAETFNGGGHTDFHVAPAGGEVGLLRFDVSALPDDALVSEVALHLTNQDYVANGTIELFVVTESWIEGTADLATGVCNWNEREVDVPWTTPGVGEGSYIDEVLDSFTPDTEDEEHVLSLPPELIEQWRDAPQENHGLLLRGETLTDPVYISTREHEEQPRRPLLVVTYYE